MGATCAGRGVGAGRARGGGGGGQGDVGARGIPTFDDGVDVAARGFCFAREMAAFKPRRLLLSPSKYFAMHQSLERRRSRN